MDNAMTILRELREIEAHDEWLFNNDHLFTYKQYMYLKDGLKLRHKNIMARIDKKLAKR